MRLLHVAADVADAVAEGAVVYESVFATVLIEECCLLFCRKVQDVSSSSIQDTKELMSGDMSVTQAVEDVEKRLQSNLLRRVRNE